jgi:hypothetical protein
MATGIDVERVLEQFPQATREEIEAKWRDVRQTVATARQTAKDTVAAAIADLQRHPTRAVGTGIIIGAAAGAFAGFAAGWFLRRP